MAFAPDANQSRIFDFVRSGKGSAVVVAVAGGGKTTTLVELLGLLSPKQRVIFLAFNKAIAEELARRVPSFVACKTFHSVGFSAIRSTFGRAIVDAEKTRKLFDALLADPEAFAQLAALCSLLEPVQPGQTHAPRAHPDALRILRRSLLGGVRKLVGLAKNAGMAPRGVSGLAGLVEDSEDAWETLLAHHQIELEYRAATIFAARAILRRSIETASTSVDFDDMLYVPVLTRAKLPVYDFVCVDEAQDVSAIQREMLGRMVRRSTGRLIAVGDPAQAIYGFRGADSSSLPRIAQHFDAIELPLSFSYRCPQAVVAEARKLVTHIEPHPSAPVGIVEDLGLEWGPAAKNVAHSRFRPTDAILCRNNAPLVSLAFRLIASGQGCRILGRDIGDSLIALARNLKAKSLADLDAKLSDYEKREQARLEAAEKPAAIEALLDRCACLRTVIGNVGSLDELVSTLEDLFKDNGSSLVTLATIHKAKGLEWERVYFLDRHLLPSKWAKLDWMLEQERNLEYVGITRAKAELYFIESPRRTA
jgi:superfamily I DNA/RNA helicase